MTPLGTPFRASLLFSPSTPGCRYVWNAEDEHYHYELHAHDLEPTVLHLFLPRGSST